MKRVLITAFDAFANFTVNPSEKLLQSIDSSANDKRIIKVVLPTIYGQAEDKLIRTIEKEKPNAILLLGYSDFAKPIKLETLARNRDYEYKLDNLGQPGKPIIDPKGPKTIDTTLPVDIITKAWDKADITYSLSDNAGGLCCNRVYYMALNWLAKSGLRDVPCAFIHIGKTTEELAQAKKALDLMLAVL